MIHRFSKWHQRDATEYVLNQEHPKSSFWTVEIQAKDIFPCRGSYLLTHNIWYVFLIYKIYKPIEAKFLHDCCSNHGLVTSTEVLSQGFIRCRSCPVPIALIVHSWRQANTQAKIQIVQRMCNSDLQISTVDYFFFPQSKLYNKSRKQMGTSQRVTSIRLDTC